MNKSAPSTKQILFSTMTTCLLVGVFWIFFDASKHNELLVKANVFLEDPYDAVGSFGIQLAAMGALLAFVRVLRPYPQGIPAQSLAVIIRGELAALCAIGVTLSADGVAMVRNLPGWTGLSAGWQLAGSASALWALTALAGWRVCVLGRTLNMPSGRGAWPKTLAVCLAVTLVLRFYPEGWRQGVPGGVFTALVGMAILFISSAAIVNTVFQPSGEPSEDSLDDFYALYDWVKAHAGPAGWIFRTGERGMLPLAKIPWISACIQWLNPRKHAWNLVILAGMGVGAALLAVEIAVEGAPKANTFLMVASVFTGIEAGGALLGYALFKEYLGIFKS